MKTLLSFLLLAAGLVIFPGCATPQSRIDKNPEAFARLTPQEQQLIKEGKVAIGFDQTMVKLAIGDPDRIRVRTNAQGETEVWSYVTYEGTDGVILYQGYYHRYFFGDPMYPYYMGYPGRREHEHFRVIFRDGRVIQIENETK